MGSDIGFIGIGMMGFQMAGNVRKKMSQTATLHVFDVSETACQRFLDQFGTFGPVKVAASSREVAERSKTIISMVPNGVNAEEVYLDKKDGIIAAPADPDRLYLESSTIDIATTQAIGKEIMNTGMGIYVDTPVSGGVAGAEGGTLSFSCGYSENKDSDPTAKRIFDTVHYMGAPEKITFCGELGTGLVCKIVNNYISLSNIVTAAQGMAFGVKHGVDKTILYKCVRGSSGASWVMDNARPVPGVIAKSPSSNGFRPGFTPRLCVKDVSLGIQAAEEVGVGASMGEAALKIFKQTDEDPRTTGLDCSAIWLHISDE